MEWPETGCRLGNVPASVPGIIGDSGMSDTRRTLRTLVMNENGNEVSKERRDR